MVPSARKLHSGGWPKDPYNQVVHLSDMTAHTVECLSRQGETFTGRTEIMPEAESLLSHLRTLEDGMKTSAIKYANSSKLQLLCSNYGPFEQCNEAMGIVIQRCSKEGWITKTVQRVKRRRRELAHQTPLQDILAVLRCVQTLTTQTLYEALG